MDVEEYKIALIGAGSVGKTSIIFQLIQGRFVECFREYLPLESSYRKQMESDGRIFLLEIMDIGRISSTENGISDASPWAFLLVYDIMSRSSFEEIPSFRDEILRHPRNNESEVPLIMLIGNKCDQRLASFGV